MKNPILHKWLNDGIGKELSRMQLPAFLGKKTSISYVAVTIYGITSEYNFYDFKCYDFIELCL